MGFWLIVGVIYSVVTIFAVYMTYQEQCRQGRQSLVCNTIGYVLCTVWPLLVAAILVLVQYRPAKAFSSESD